MADVRIVTRLDGAPAVQKGLTGIQAGLAGIGRVATTATAGLNTFATAASRVGTILTLGVSAPLALASGALIKFASDAVESENLFAVSMGNMADEARAFSEEMRTQLGLNAFEVRKNIATFFQMTSSMGIAADAAFDMSKGLTQLTGDLASFFNLRPDDAFLKLQSAISGEIEPMRRLGVNVSETNVKMTLLRMGLIDTSSKLTEQQKIIGRYLTILEATRNAQGDLARTMESPANQLRIIGARFQDAAITLGTSLLPAVQVALTIITRLASGIADLVDQFIALDPWIKGAAIAVVGIAIAAGPAVKLLGLMAAALSGLITVLSVVLSPIGLVVAGIVALTAAVVASLTAQQSLGRFMERIWAGIKITVRDAILSILGGLADLFNAIGLFEEGFNTARQSILETFGTETQAELDQRLGQTGELFRTHLDEIATNIEMGVDRIKELLAAPFEALSTETQADVESAFLSIQTDLETLKDAFGQAGEEMAKTGKTVAEKWEESNQLANERMRLELTDTSIRTQGIARTMHASLQTFFINTVKGASSMGALIKAIFKDLANAILAEFARIAASSVFNVLFGGGGGGGLFGGLSGGGGLVGLFGAAFSIGSLFSGFGGLGPQFTGTGAEGLLASGSFQTGGQFTVTRPTSLLVGEVGPERVTISPAGVRRGSGGANVIFQGINILDDVSMARFRREIGRGMAEEATRIV